MLERLQKIIARAGIASRRHAEELIRSGQVRVNGLVVTELGAKADPDKDRVEAAGRVAERPAKSVYYLLYKPPHVVSTMSDPEGRATLRHVLRGLASGVFPVGRLDYAASGLMLLTSDGQLADRMFKASSCIPQVYWIKVKGQLGHDLLREIGRRAHARLRGLPGPSAAGKYAENPWYEVEFGEARRDLLAHELFAAGHPVEKMKRVKVGPLELGNLAEGHYRELQPGELTRLRQAIDRAGEARGPEDRAGKTHGREDRAGGAHGREDSAEKAPQAVKRRGTPRPFRGHRPPRSGEGSREGTRGGNQVPRKADHSGGRPARRRPRKFEDGHAD